MASDASITKRRLYPVDEQILAMVFDDSAYRIVHLFSIGRCSLLGSAHKKSSGTVLYRDVDEKNEANKATQAL